MADENTGMPKGEMRKLLVRSKEEPVNCAVGIGDKGIGLMILHKTKGPKILEKQLMLEFRDAKSVRWGTAFVDIDDNPKLVKLTLNRNASGLAKRLSKSLKGTGFSKVALVFEDGTEAETAEDEDEAPAGAAAAPPPPPEPPRAVKTPEEIAAQAALLAKALAALAPLIPKAAGEDAERRAALLKMAGDANVNIKTGNLKIAGEMLVRLKAELQAAAPAATPPADLQTLMASRQIWTGTQEKVRAEVDKLRAELSKAYKGQPFAGEVEKRFETRVAPVVATFDDQLLDTLDDIMNTKDAAERAKLTAHARELIKGYLTFAATDPFIGDLDANPFVPLSIKSTVTADLAKLAKDVH